MNEDIERLKLTIYRLIGENNGLRFVVGLPEKNYELRGCELYCGNEPCDNSKEKNSGCIILDIRTGKKVV
ncbi:hypothetical protein [Bacteroides timonensis]|jgi:hypothetical protein|uniref:hypothetical protein n=1 Tax=Bacteroides timonensis TaxID=1470345 RepID=UPI0004B81508|nr:hypothetical protein [Bacteroides timonensis]